MAKNKDAIAFLHDANARNDLKIAPLRQKFGLEGYGAFFMIVEILREQANFKIDLSDIEGINCQLKPHELDFKNFLEFCFEKKLFKRDKKYMWSDSLLRRMKAFTDARKRMSEGGKKGMKKRYKDLTSTLQVPRKVNQTNINQNKTNEININQLQIEAKKILTELNRVTGKNFQDTGLIIENLINGKTIEQHMHIVMVKQYDSHFTDHPNHMNPGTLFGKNFDIYVNQNIEDFRQPKKGGLAPMHDDGPPKEDLEARKKWRQEQIDRALED